MPSATPRMGARESPSRRDKGCARGYQRSCTFGDSGSGRFARFRTRSDTTLITHKINVPPAGPDSKIKNQALSRCAHMNCLWRGNGHGAKGVAADVALCCGKRSNKGPTSQNLTKFKIRALSRCAHFPEIMLGQRVRARGRLLRPNNCSRVSASTQRSFGSAHFKGPSKRMGTGASPRSKPAKFQGQG